MKTPSGRSFPFLVSEHRGAAGSGAARSCGAAEFSAAAPGGYGTAETTKRSVQGMSHRIHGNGTFYGKLVGKYPI